MGSYEANLRHIAEPQAPSEREKAVATTIEDYEALWLSEVLREFAHYADHDHEAQSGIAIGYASYIDQKVRSEGSSYVTLYAHTDVAAETLLDALYWDVPDDDRRDYPMVLFRSLEGAFAEVFAHYVDDPETPEAPPEPEVDDDMGVVFDPDDARESIAMKQMAEKEAEREAELDRRREQAFDEGRL